jgi:SAM-dependent methyltransferase
MTARKPESEKSPVALEARNQSGRARMHSPSASRNKAPILDVLRIVLPKQGRVLEIGCGAGEHAVHFAAALPELFWQTSDPDADARASTSEWIVDSRLSNVGAPLTIDVTASAWEDALCGDFDAIVSINMIHIAPWAASIGLFAGAGRTLRAGGLLLLYGPFMCAGVHNAPSNEMFDASLKSRNSTWGVRDIVELEKLAEGAGHVLREKIAMPANNFALVFEKRSD